MSRTSALVVAIAGVMAATPAIAGKKKEVRARGVVELTGQRAMSFVPQGPNEPIEGEPTTALFALGKDTTAGGLVGVKFAGTPLFIGLNGRYDGGGAVAAVRQADDNGTVDLVTYRLTSTSVNATIGAIDKHWYGYVFIGGGWGAVEVERTLEGTDDAKVRTSGVSLGGRGARRFKLPGPLDFVVGSELSLTDHNADENFMPYAPDADDSTASLRYGLFGGLVFTI